jgi:hypothetical protein
MRLASSSPASRIGENKALMGGLIMAEERPKAWDQAQ